MKCPYVIKVCTKCKRILVANTMNFNKQKDNKYGLKSICKKCRKQYRDEHEEELREKRRRYYHDNKEVIRKKHKQYNEKNKEKRKMYNEKHKMEKSEYRKRYYEENKNKEKEINKRYREENLERIKEREKQYYKNNPEKFFNSRNKRRQLEENQGNGVSKEQWYEMMCFFEWRCAYSGEYIGGDSEYRTIDHIIPLSLGGLNEIWNLVPCYASYNFSKHTKDMEDWYIEQDFFDINRLLKIYEWIEYAYNKWH